MTGVDWRAFRAQFPMAARTIFMNHAGTAPIPDACRAAIRRYADDACESGAAHSPDWQARVEAVRATFGRLVGAPAERVAFVENTSAGLSFVAQGLDWRPGDVIVAPGIEYPSNVYPWWGLERLGVETRLVPAAAGRCTVDALARACEGGRVRLLSVSAVQFATGYRADLATLAQLCRDRGALFCVDGIQALGAFPIDTERDGIDFLAAGGQKWLLSVQGVGTMACSARGLAALRPSQLGWNSVQPAEPYLHYRRELRADAAKLEAGTLNVVGIHALGASLDLILGAGLPAIASRILSLTDRLVEGLARRGWEVRSPRAHEAEKSGIVMFLGRREEPPAVFRRLLAAGAVVASREGLLRASPHAWNDEEDVERLLDLLGSG